MNSPIARTIYAGLAVGSFALGLAWVKFELIDEPYPHDGWVAAVWIGSALVLGWAAVRGGNDGHDWRTRVAVPLAVVLSVGLTVVVFYGISQLD